MQPIFQEIGNMIKNEIEHNFEKESTSDGKKWSDTKNNKRARGGKVLVDNSILNTSFTYIANNNGVEVGTNLIYARVHNFGGKAGRGAKVIIPKRSFLPLDDNNELNDRVSREIMGYLFKKVGI